MLSSLELIVERNWLRELEMCGCDPKLRELWVRDGSASAEGATF